MNHLIIATRLLLLAPLITGLFAGIGGHFLPKIFSQLVAIAGILVAFIASLILFNGVILDHAASFSVHYYTWAISQDFTIPIDVLIDHLSILMVTVVTFVSLLVHIYSIGYMRDDASNPRFFCYMALFTFAMLTLVLANNFLLLFFGWEGVGLMSYLLIGFWFHKNSAAEASLKAFIINRVSDCAFFLGIAAVYTYFHSVDFAVVFAHLNEIAPLTLSIFPNQPWSVITIIGILLFIGAMGKSAQVPLHVWLPESMEGPTPISALIHAATMVTAGIYLIARLSPLYEYSPTALTFILIIGSTQALFMGLLGIVQWDIKRVIAYSTLSQLGYMVAGLGASAFSASLFHLFTHACFKALLFLAAGAIIIAMHHEQDMRKMGGLARKMPITYLCFLIGALTLAAIPPTAGFFSKDSILDAVAQTTLPGAHYAYACLLLGVFVTALYIFRAFFLVFHGKPATRQATHEVSSVMWWPLIALAIPSLIIGVLCIKPLLIEPNGWLGQSLLVFGPYNSLNELITHFPGIWPMVFNALTSLPFWLGISGIVVAWLSYVIYPSIPAKCAKISMGLYQSLVHEYGFNAFNNLIFVRGSIKMSQFFASDIDGKVIDSFMVNGSGRLINRLSNLACKLQSGYLYQYALVMILSLFAFIVWQVLL